MYADKNRKGPLYVIKATLLALIFCALFAAPTFAKPAQEPPLTGMANVPVAAAPAIDASSTITSGAANLAVEQINRGNQRGTNDNAQDAQSGRNSSNNSTIKPSSEPDGKFLVDEYDDPGKPKEKTSFFIQLIYTIWDIIKYIFYLALVLGIGFLAVYGIKLFTTKYNAFGGGDLVNILEVKYIAPGKAVCLVEIAGKVLALGLTGNNINLLSEFTETDHVEELRKAAAKKPEPLQPFQGILERFSKRFSTPVQGKTVKSVKKRRGKTANSAADWKDDLYSTGDNIRKLLDEIKEQEQKARGSDSSSNRGEDKR
ncbi:MAG: flagellar biosynthetic protein FliO [Firmicutes bacterium]|nr:flagellar biosynthetic protein FliO [Bacillota bacterium]